MSTRAQHKLSLPNWKPEESPNVIAYSPNHGHRPLPPDPSPSSKCSMVVSPSYDRPVMQPFFSPSPRSHQPQICSPQSTESRGETPDHDHGKASSLPPALDRTAEVKSAPNNVRIRSPMPQRALPPSPNSNWEALPPGWAKWTDHKGTFYLDITTNERRRDKPTHAASGDLREESVLTPSAGNIQLQLMDERQTTDGRLECDNDKLSGSEHSIPALRNPNVIDVDHRSLHIPPEDAISLQNADTDIDNDSDHGQREQETHRVCTIETPSTHEDGMDEIRMMSRVEGQLQDLHLKRTRSLSAHSAAICDEHVIEDQFLKRHQRSRTFDHLDDNVTALRGRPAFLSPRSTKMKSQMKADKKFCDSHNMSILLPAEKKSLLKDKGSTLMQSVGQFLKRKPKTPNSQ